MPDFDALPVQEFGVFDGPVFVLPHEDIFTRLFDNPKVIREQDNYKLYVICDSFWFMRERDNWTFIRSNDNPIFESG